MLIHRLRLKLSSPILEVSAWDTQLSMKALKVYLKGLKYSNHLIHTGILTLFLNSPANIISGISTITMVLSTVLTSSTRLPTQRPSEFPHKDSRKPIKQKMKNCYAVLESPANQQMTRVMMRGNMMTPGSSTRLRLRKYDPVLYMRADSSLRKTALSMGNTSETGVIQRTKKPHVITKRYPTVILQLSETVSGWLQSPDSRATTPAQNTPTNMLWNSRLPRIKGLRNAFLKSLLSKVPMTVPQVSSASTVTFLVDLFNTWVCVRGAISSSNSSKQRGNLLRFYSRPA